MKQVYIADDPTEAHLVKGILEQYGISCEVRGEALWGARGGLPLTSEALPTIWIVDERKSLKTPYNHTSNPKHLSHFKFLLFSPVPLFQRPEITNHPGVNLTFSTTFLACLMFSI